MTQPTVPAGSPPLAPGGNPQVTTTPATPPAPPEPPAPPTPPVTPPVEPPAVPPTGNITMTSEQLNERMSRARSSHITTLGAEYGIETEADLKKALAERQKQHTEAETARQNALSNEQRLTEVNTTLTAERDAAQEALAQVQFEGAVNGSCAALGIQNTSYAQHLVLEAASAVPDGETFDERAFLEAQLQDDGQRAALTRQMPVSQPTGVTTVPGGVNPPPPPGNNPPEPVNAMNMTKEQFAAHKQGMGIGR